MNGFRWFLFFFFMMTGVAFAAKLKQGIYRGTLALADSGIADLPFNFEVKYVKRKPQIIIHNAGEKIIVDEITIRGDSVNFRMPVFDTEFRTRRTATGLAGVWINRYRSAKNRIPFTAQFGEHRRFLEAPLSEKPFTGKWETVFSPGKPDSTYAVGVFSNVEATPTVYATFLTETGDYRFLEGIQSGEKLLLSCFDGSHAYLFTAERRPDGILQGEFRSGSHWKEEWIAKRNPKATLRDAASIAIVKHPEQPIDFTFSDTDGVQHTLSEAPYAGKPVVVQLLGSWCPNCMDESRLLAELYPPFKDRVLLVALAFEKTTDIVKSRQQVKRMKDRLQLPYPVLITGFTGKERARDVIGNLDTIAAFPTTLFLDRNHRIISVHSGFSGPATGAGFERERERFQKLFTHLSGN